MTQQVTSPASHRVQPRMSYAEFLERYMNSEHVEWVDGEAVEMPAVSYTNANIAMFLAALLRFALDLRKAGIVLTEPYNMKTGPDLPGRSPDVLVVTSEHLSRVREDHLEGPADVVFEIVSESSRTVDRVDKFREYQT